MVCIDYVFLVLLFCAALTDLKLRKIPNRLIVIGYACGMVRLCMKHGPKGMLMCAGLILLVWLLLVPVYSLGGLGGGDCKLLAMIPLFLEPEELLGCYFLIFACAGAWGLLKRIVFGERHICFGVAVFLGVVLSKINLL